MHTYVCMYVCMYVCTYVFTVYVCMYVCLPSIPYHIRFNFRGVKLLQIADYSNFCVFISVDAGS